MGAKRETTTILPRIEILPKGVGALSVHPRGCLSNIIFGGRRSDHHTTFLFVDGCCA